MLELSALAGVEHTGAGVPKSVTTGKEQWVALELPALSIANEQWVALELPTLVTRVENLRDVSKIPQKKIRRSFTVK